MDGNAAIVSVFNRYRDADAAVKTLTGAGFPIRDIGIIGDEYHTEFAAADAFNGNGRVESWGVRGAVAGALGALMLDALIMSTTTSGGAPVYAYLVAVGVYVIEGAVALGCLGMMAAAICNFAERRSGAVHYDRRTVADGFLVILRATGEQTVRAKRILSAMSFERHYISSSMTDQNGAEDRDIGVNIPPDIEWQMPGGIAAQFSPACILPALAAESRNLRDELKIDFADDGAFDLSSMPRYFIGPNDGGASSGAAPQFMAGVFDMVNSSVPPLVANDSGSHARELGLPSILSAAT
jgi:hypothetical protein